MLPKDDLGAGLRFSRPQNQRETAYKGTKWSAFPALRWETFTPPLTCATGKRNFRACSIFFSLLVLGVVGLPGPLVGPRVVGLPGPLGFLGTRLLRRRVVRFLGARFSILRKHRGGTEDQG